MGLIVDKPELLAALDRSDRDIRSQQAEAGRAMSALDGLAGDASLDGRGWQAAKLHAADAARPRLEAAVRQGDRVMAANAEFRQRLDSLIQDDYLDEDGIADCVRRLRRNDGLLRQAQDLLPADGGPLKGLIDQLRQQGEQQADRLEDKIQRLHTLDQTTRNLYQDTATPQPGNDTNLDGDANALMAKVVNGKMNRKQLTDFFEKKMHMSHKDAAELAYFTMRFRTYAKNKKFSSKQAVYEYVRILASVSYNSRIWRTAGGTYKNDKLISILKRMGYTNETAKKFIADMDKMHSSDGRSRDSVDFIHMMGSLSCMLNPGPGGGAYHAGGMEPDLSGPGGAASQRDRSAEAASWGGDVASGAGGRADWNADMDAINLSHYIQAHPKVDRQEAVRDYYAQLSKGNLERNRIRQFCGNYDPRNEGDPQRGLDYLKENGLYIATGSAEGQYLGAGIGEDKQRATLKDFLDMLRKGMG